MAENTVSVNIKMSGQGETFEFDLDTANNVEQVLDKIVEKKPDLKNDSVTLVRKGRILKNDQVMKDVGVAKGETLHVVKKSASAPKESEDSKEQTSADSSSQQPNPFASMFGGGMPGMGMPGMGMPGMGMPGMGAPGMGMPSMDQMGGMPGGMGGMGGMPGGMNPDMIANMLNNPMVKGMINDLFSDPDKLKNMFEQNPVLGQMAEGNEEIQDLMSNPDKLKDVMTDDKLDEAIKGMQGHLRGSGGAEGGNANASEGTSTANPGSNPIGISGPSGTGGPSGPGGPGGLGNMMSGVDPQMVNQMMAGFNLGSTGANATSNATTTSSYENMSEDELKKKFESQLQQMRDMGFTDDTENIKILKETNGDASKAIEKALEKMG